ncbi:MAG: gamma-glutamyltransferase family protein [Opitutaceae bacterium]
MKSSRMTPGRPRFLHWSFLLLSAAVVGTQAIAAHRIEAVRGAHGMVVAGHPEAAEIGMRILADGGNAIDAAVATSLALGVAEPYGSGIGGKCAIVYFDAVSGECAFVDGMDAAGMQMDPEAFSALSSRMKSEGARSVGVPGLVAALALAHEKWGSRAWSELVQPAAELASRGSLVVPGMPVFFSRRVERIRSNPEAERLYLPAGQPPLAGSRLPNPDLARTLGIIAREGRSGLYEGEVARTIVEELQSGGGVLTLADFSTYTARLSPPLKIDWKDLTIVSSPAPTTGGATVLLTLKALENEDWNPKDTLLTAENIDRWGRMLRQVYPMIQDQVADTADAPDRWQKLVDPANLAFLRVAAGERPETAPIADVAIARDGWTTHFVVADDFGNVASITQSLSDHFGSGVIAPGTGVVLNNSLKNFSFAEPGTVNFPAPGKRPRSTIAPTLILKDGWPIVAIGLPGGQRIPTATLQVLLDHLVFDRNLGQAITAPRVHLVRSYSERADSTLLQWEGPPAEGVAEGLAAAGWEIEVITDPEAFGGFTAIEIGADGTKTGWADPRRTNHASGY